MKRRKKSSRIKRLGSKLARASDREAVDSKGWHADADRDALAVFAAYAYTPVKTRVVSDKLDL